MNPHSNDDKEIETSVANLKTLLTLNCINIKKFAQITKDHLFQKTKKKNNLIFYGPPSTGKTMIMSSLVSTHYNYERLTGLTPGSSLDFSSL